MIPLSNQHSSQPYRRRDDIFQVSVVIHLHFFSFLLKVFVVIKPVDSESDIEDLLFC